MQSVHLEQERLHSHLLFKQPHRPGATRPDPRRTGQEETAASVDSAGAYNGHALLLSPWCYSHCAGDGTKTGDVARLSQGLLRAMLPVAKGLVVPLVALVTL